MGGQERTERAKAKMKMQGEQTDRQIALLPATNLAFKSKGRSGACFGYGGSARDEEAEWAVLQDKKKRRQRRMETGKRQRERAAENEAPIHTP